MKTVVAAAVLGSFAACSLAGEPPANIWTLLSDGAGQGCGPAPELLWMADADTAMIGPFMSESRKANPAQSTLTFDAPVWTNRLGNTPAGWIADMWESPRDHVYLPGIKQVLYARPEWGYSPKRPASGWLVDPADWSWKPLTNAFSMSDRSADFNPTAGRDGLRLPIWGAACYDALNKEGVFFGGGGVWGRVGREKEKVGPDDWIFDEAAKRVRRILPGETGVTEARKWFPGHCGTWTFSEAEKQWKAIEQPLGGQPSGRILPAMAYDPDAKKILLFGGDDLARCLGDTWSYDCATRTWTRLEPKVAPTARAGHALVYVPGQKVFLLAGGYAGGWRPLKDVWVFDPARGEWQRLGLDLPAVVGGAGAAYDPKRKLVLLASVSGIGGAKATPVHLLRLDLATAPKAEPEKAEPLKDWHCKGSRWTSDLPDEWLTGAGAPEKPEEVRARIKALPANTWKDMNPPKKARERTWGIYIYDPRSHKGYAWGGGHSGYPGAEITEYHLLINRWVGMRDPTNYNPFWLHGMVGGPPGISFGGWSLLPSHARKSYGIDPLSNSIITYSGDVYSMEHQRFVNHIGNFPVDWNGPSYQVAYVTTPHGLYGFAATYGSKSAGWLCRADVAKGTWEVVSKDGPGGHYEYDFLVYDSKRDRALYIRYKGGEVWAFDFKAKTWAKDEVAGKAPPIVMGDGAYIPEMDAAMMMYADEPKGAEKLFFYKCAERKWYTAPSAGDPFRGANSAKDYSPIYDPELGIVVRITQCGFADRVNVHVMRLDPATLKLTPVE
jgi:hypothetical protein